MRQEKKRIVQWDIIRIICMYIIVCYHISSEMLERNASGYLPFRMTANGAWGAMMVTTFFVLSGSSLYYSNGRFETRKQVIEFYKRRIREILIPYWVTWTISYILKSVMLKTPAWGGAWPKVLLTLLGLDGYTRHLGENYYLIGEWFFGAIVIIYFLYPLTRNVFEKYMITGTLILFAVYIIAAKWNPLQIDAYRHITTYLWTFWIGMLFGKYRNRLGCHIIGIPCIIIAGIVIFVPLPAPGVINLVIGGTAFFAALYYFSTLIENITAVKIAPILYKSSFLLYLVHHQIINRTAGLFARIYIPGISMVQILFYAVLIYIAGCVYYIIYKRAEKAVTTWQINPLYRKGL